MNDVKISVNLLAQTIGVLGQIKSARGLTHNDITALQQQLQACAQPQPPAEPPAQVPKK